MRTIKKGDYRPKMRSVRNKDYKSKLKAIRMRLKIQGEGHQEVS
jgi:hypothetical protein